MEENGDERQEARWLALYVLCLGDLMIVLDTNIVNVALPSIQADLGFSQSALAWVVNAYLLTFGGFLLLSGRLGDLLRQQAGLPRRRRRVHRSPRSPAASRRTPGCSSSAGPCRASAAPPCRRSPSR